MTVSTFGNEYVQRLEDDRKVMVEALEKVAWHCQEEWAMSVAVDALNKVMSQDFPPKRGRSEWNTNA